VFSRDLEGESGTDRVQRVCQRDRRDARRGAGHELVQVGFAKCVRQVLQARKRNVKQHPTLTSKPNLSVKLTRGYLNLPPQIFLKLSALSDSCMKRYPSSKLAATTHFFYLQNIEQNVKNMKNCQTAGNIAKYSKSQP